MSKQVLDDSGNPIPFTCANRRFETNVNKGEPHGEANTRGSVFPDALIDHGRHSLWLEHVRGLQDGHEVYWLMWYDHAGRPTIPMSGVFGKEDLTGMIEKLIRIREEVL